MNQIIYVRCENYGNGKIKVSFYDMFIIVSYNKIIQLRNGDYAVRARRDWQIKEAKGIMRVLINTKKGVIKKTIAIDDIVQEEEMTKDDRKKNIRTD